MASWVENALLWYAHAVNMIMLTSAADHPSAVDMDQKVATPDALCSNQSISPACRARSSKPAARQDGTDRQMNTRQFHRPCSTYYVSSVNKTQTSSRAGSRRTMPNIDTEWSDTGCTRLCSARYSSWQLVRWTGPCRAAHDAAVARRSVCLRRNRRRARITSTFSSGQRSLCSNKRVCLGR